MSERTRASYDRVAGRYAAEVGGELAGKPVDRALLAALAGMTAAAGPGPVLDLGGGPGHVAAHLAGLGARVVHADLSLRMCEVARRAGLPSAQADLVALPFRSGAAAGVVCLYAVIHLDTAGRAAAYAELLRVLRPGGLALVAFHTSDAETASGSAATLTSWWDEPVALTFRFLDASAEADLLTAAGFDPVARLDRAPVPGEHPSRRSSLLVRRPAEPVPGGRDAAAG